jgi:hypothetical protein
MLVTATSSATSRRKKQIIRRHGTAFGLIHWRIRMGLMISRSISIHSPSARRATRQLVTNNDRMGFCSPNNLSMHILIPRDSLRIEGRLPPALSDSPFSDAHPGRSCGQHMASPKRASRVVEIANTACSYNTLFDSAECWANGLALRSVDAENVKTDAVSIHLQVRASRTNYTGR